MFARQLESIRHAHFSQNTPAIDENKYKQTGCQDVEMSSACICNRKPQDVLCKACGHHFIGRVRRKCPVHMSAILLMDVMFCPTCQSEQLIEIKTCDSPAKPSEDDRLEKVLKEWRDARPSRKEESHHPPMEEDDWEEDWERSLPVHTQAPALSGIVDILPTVTEEAEEEDEWDIRPAVKPNLRSTYSETSLNPLSFASSPGPVASRSLYDASNQSNVLSAVSSPLSIACMRGVGRGTHGGLSNATRPNSSPVQAHTPTLPTMRQLDLGSSPETIIRKTVFFRKDKSSSGSPAKPSIPQSENKFNIVVHSTGKLGDRFSSSDMVETARRNSFEGGDAMLNTMTKGPIEDSSTGAAAQKDLHLGIKR